jgi:hypothetical protein
LVEFDQSPHRVEYIRDLTSTGGQYVVFELRYAGRAIALGQQTANIQLGGHGWMEWKLPVVLLLDLSCRLITEISGTSQMQFQNDLKNRLFLDGEF